MRPVLVVMCIFAAACSGQAAVSPIAPVGPAITAAGTPVQGGSQLPLQGSYTSTSASTFSPPITLVINGTAAGTATQLGSFTATYTHYVDTTTKTAIGTITLTAANGDWLRADLTGAEDEFIPPNISRTTSVATIVEGSGRFASATGTFTIHSRGVIDFGAGTSTESATFAGTIDLNR